MLMTSSEQIETDTPLPGEAFLVIHRGPARRSIVRLHPGEITTIGRANANRIVIPDAKCSRHHCEIFFSEGRWSVRDLDSRNGVLINGAPVDGEAKLEPEQVLVVGSCEIKFSHHAPNAARIAAESLQTGEEIYEIVERASGTRFDKPLAPQEDAEGAATRRRTRAGLDELYQLARAMAEPKDTVSLAQETLDGLFAGTSATIGAVLLFPEPMAEPDSRRLECVAFHCLDDSLRKTVSSYLSRAVCEDHEALLARDLSSQESLSDQDSLGTLKAESAICTPVRQGDRLAGVVHLYATSPETPLDADDLEFALAVSDQFAIALENVRDRESLKEGISRVAQQNIELLHQLEVETELVGDSEQTNALRAQIGRVAPSEAIVLIRGESGVGKELVARAVHFNSSRRRGPFVCVNCAALTESLLESELFGHEKGSFTGAAAQKIGKFEQADGGTLFLDEVGEMSGEIQAKFLRVLEGHSFERVGGSKPIQIDVRVVTATNRNLEQAVKDGEFRQDLFFRLQVLEIVVPPLREHPEDIPAIAAHFLARTAAKSTIKVSGFTREALDVLRDYWWPGNVRELKNVIERSVILSDHTWLTAEDVRLLNLSRPTPLTPSLKRDLGRADSASGQESASAGQDPSGRDPLQELVEQEASLEDMERRFIAATLEKLSWNKSRSARQLGIERTTLDRKIRKYGLEKPE
jgi:transcriptional regulator with GAF, ATPase, and Fis domain